MFWEQCSQSGVCWVQSPPENPALSLVPRLELRFGKILTPHCRY